MYGVSKYHANLNTRNIAKFTFVKNWEKLKTIESTTKKKERNVGNEDSYETP
jgi:hypothetical protein